MEKYQEMVLKQVNDKFREWNGLEFILEKDLYVFLHSLKGTAGSVGLHELTTVASEKLQSLTEDSEKNG